LTLDASIVKLQLGLGLGSVLVYRVLCWC